MSKYDVLYLTLLRIVLWFLIWIDIWSLDLTFVLNRYTQELFEKENPTLDDDYRAENIFEPVLVGFQEMTRFFRTVLVDFIYSPLEEDFVKFFSKEWYVEYTLIRGRIIFVFLTCPS
jgi:hypothetical protein